MSRLRFYSDILLNRCAYVTKIRSRDFCEAVNVLKYCQLMAHTLWGPTRRSTFRNYEEKNRMNVQIQLASM